MQNDIKHPILNVTAPFMEIPFMEQHSSCLVDEEWAGTQKHNVLNVSDPE